MTSSPHTQIKHFSSTSANPFWGGIDLQYGRTREFSEMNVDAKTSNPLVAPLTATLI